MSIIHNALQRRRKQLRPDSEAGFTLIELLVVVIIIGILAAIAIPVYLGVQNNAKDSGVQSDLGNFKTAVVSYQTSTGAALATGRTSYTSAAGLNSTLATAGATLGSSTTSLTFYPTSSGFCVLGISSTGKSYAATDSLGAMKGSCTNTGLYSTAVVTVAP